jgi:hypothetical protein
MPKRICFELSEVTVVGHSKKRWNLYMIFMMDHPENRNQKIITTLPDDGLFLKIQNKDDNKYSFKSMPVTPISSGKRILDLQIPENGYVGLSCLVMHSRDNQRDAAAFMESITNTIELPEIPGKLKFLELSVPWMVVANTAVSSLGVIGRQMEQLEDRQLDLIHIQVNLSAWPSGATIFPDRAGAVGKGAQLSFDWRLT